ncbi:hypothetical protein J7K97_04545 [Candidatus Aerophobetes bacterium]|nr:hypothetical protein [Candidatus Aerophobetes bacterium]
MQEKSKIIGKLLNVDCRATGIGSMPHTDINYVCDLILDKCPDIPFWPQLPRVDPRENMIIQFSENLPYLKLNSEKKSIHYEDVADREDRLLRCYDYIVSNDYDYFKLSEDYARGFYPLLEKSKKKSNLFIKGQVVGPVTFLASIEGKEKALIYDNVASDTILMFLGMKGLWQAKQIKKIGKIPIIFYDEPYLSSFGSAYFPLEKEKIVSMINNLVDFIKEREKEILVGIHCCGNTDWGMILETKIDIISFDSYGFSKYFVLYADEIKRFLERDGIIAWGAVPTTEYSDSISLEILHQKLDETLEVLVKKGLDRRLLLRNSLFTPSCGVGLAEEKISEKIIDLVSNLSGYFV